MPFDWNIKAIIFKVIIEVCMLTSVMVSGLSDSCKHQDITSKPGPGSLAKPEH